MVRIIKFIHIISKYIYTYMNNYCEYRSLQSIVPLTSASVTAVNLDMTLNNSSTLFLSRRSTIFFTMRGSLSGLMDTYGSQLLSCFRACMEWSAPQFSCPGWKKEYEDINPHMELSENPEVLPSPRYENINHAWCSLYLNSSDQAEKEHKDIKPCIQLGFSQYFFPGANFPNQLTLSQLLLCVRFKPKNRLWVC